MHFHIASSGVPAVARPWLLGCAPPSCAASAATSSTQVHNHTPFLFAGDAYFDLDAAQFLLEELQHQRRVAAATAEQQGKPEHGGEAAAAAVQQQQQQLQLRQQPPAKAAQQDAGTPPASSQVLGHAVGPRWVQQLPTGAAAENGSGSGLGSVELEYGAEIAAIQFAPAGSTAGKQQAQQQAQQGEAGAAGAAGDAGADGSLAARPLLLSLTNGRQLEADLVLLAIGVRPALEWVPASLERARDGGLRVNRCGAQERGQHQSCLHRARA